MALSSRSNFPFSIVLLGAAKWEFWGHEAPVEEIKTINSKEIGAMK